MRGIRDSSSRAIAIAATTPQTRLSKVAAVAKPVSVPSITTRVRKGKPG